MLRLTVSTTSTNASFFLYFTSPLLQLVAPVACDVIFDDSSYTYQDDATQTVTTYFPFSIVRKAKRESTYCSNLRRNHALGCDITLQGIDLAILGVSKVVDFYTINHPTYKWPGNQEDEEVKNDRAEGDEMGKGAHRQSTHI